MCSTGCWRAGGASRLRSLDVSCMCLHAGPCNDVQETPYGIMPYAGPCSWLPSAQFRPARCVMLPRDIGGVACRSLQQLCFLKRIRVLC